MDEQPQPAPTKEDINDPRRRFEDVLTFRCWESEIYGGNFIRFHGTNYRRTQTGDWEIAIEDD